MSMNTPAKSIRLYMRNRLKLCFPCLLLVAHKLGNNLLTNLKDSDNFFLSDPKWEISWKELYVADCEHVSKPIGNIFAPNVPVFLASVRVEIFQIYINSIESYRRNFEKNISHSYP